MNFIISAIRKILLGSIGDLPYIVGTTPEDNDDRLARYRRKNGPQRVIEAQKQRRIKMALMEGQQR